MSKILVIDDEESIQLFYADELTEEGYQVITSGDGSRLLELIEQTRPDLIVMDSKLGECNGLDLLQDIRKNHDDLPVILCTAYSNLEYNGMPIPADYLVAKSSNLKELKLKIKMAIKGKRDQMELALGVEGSRGGTRRNKNGSSDGRKNHTNISH